MSERGDEFVKLRDPDTPLANHALEHVAFVEPLHADEPVDRGAGSADREPIAGIHQRQTSR